MGCWTSRVNLTNCTSWQDLANQTKVYDEKINTERDKLLKISEKNRSATEKELISFYKAFIPWNPTLVTNKKWTPDLLTKIEHYYSYIDGEKGSISQTKMEEDYVELSKDIDLLLEKEIHKKNEKSDKSKAGASSPKKDGKASTIPNPPKRGSMTPVAPKKELKELKDKELSESVVVTKSNTPKNEIKLKETQEVVKIDDEKVKQENQENQEKQEKHEKEEKLESAQVTKEIIAEEIQIEPVYIPKKEKDINDIIKDIQSPKKDIKPIGNSPKKSIISTSPLVPLKKETSPSTPVNSKKDNKDSKEIKEKVTPTSSPKRNSIVYTPTKDKNKK